MKLLIVLAPLYFILTCLTPAKKRFATNIPVQGYTLAWQDEFNGTSLDRNYWNILLGQRGDASYVPQTISFDGNNLILKVGMYRDSVYAGFITTKGLYETIYGYFECRARTTHLPGLWSAFWLQSPHNGDNSIPERDGLELDIFEYFPHIRKDAVMHCIHYGGYGATHKMLGPLWGALKNTADDYHVFGLQWEPQGYAVFVDGVKTFQGNTLVTRHPEFIVLSTEVNRLASGPLNKKMLPDSLVVDYVRVYKK